MSDEKLQDTNTYDNINNSSDLSIRVAGQVDASIEDGPGYRFVLFTQGCSHNCKGCHNPQTHSFDGGYLTTIDELIKKYDINLVYGSDSHNSDNIGVCEAYINKQ